MNAVLICYCHSQMCELHTFLKGLLAIIKFLFCHAFWWQDISICLVFSVFTSRQTSLLASDRTSVFLFMVCIFSTNVCINIVSIDQGLMYSVQFQSFIFLDPLDGFCLSKNRMSVYFECFIYLVWYFLTLSCWWFWWLKYWRKFMW